MLTVMGNELVLTEQFYVTIPYYNSADTSVPYRI